MHWTVIQCGEMLLTVIDLMVSDTSGGYIEMRCTYILSLGVMGDIGKTMVGVFTPLRLERAPPSQMRRDEMRLGVTGDGWY